ncbi:microsomal glutathione S-transferase 1-like isoform X2 [Saccoglossus kowalevskii]
MNHQKFTWRNLNVNSQVSKKYSNPEDAKAFGNAKSTEDVKRMGATDSTVERVKRVVQNDIENIYAFMALAPLYVLTAPALNTALWVFRLFTGARVAHTVCYLLSLQPFRGICWIINISINFYMAYCIYQSCAK